VAHTVTVTLLGLNSNYKEVYLELGKPLNLDAVLKDESMQLTRLKFTGSKSKSLEGRTGAETTIGRKNSASPTFLDQLRILHAFRAINS
jgi:hypothetical protein